MATAIPDVVADAILDLILHGESALDTGAGFGVDHYGDLYVYLCSADPGETGANAVAELPAKEVALNERVDITVTGSPTGGTFNLTFNAEESGAIDFDATAAEVQAALEAVSTIGAGNVVCTGGPLNTAPVEVQFVRDLRWTDVGDITLTTNNLTGGTTPGVDITVTATGMSLLTAYVDANGEIERETDTNANIEFGEASGPNTATHLALSSTNDATGYLAGVPLDANVPYESGQPVRISTGNLAAFTRGAQ